MLYDGALRFIEQGRVAMEAKNTYQQHESLVKAQRIISELTACLDMKQGGIISENLFALYTFCYNELVEANLADNPEKLATASKVLEDLRSSWISIEAQQRGENKEERLAS
jgi:flagellar protein FliS